MTAVIRTPNFTSVPLRVRMKASEKSGLPMTAAISGLMMPSTRRRRCLEGGTDDDTDGQLNDVAARDEFLEALKHGFLLELYFQL